MRGAHSFFGCGNLDPTPGGPLADGRDAETPPTAYSADGAMPWLCRVELASSHPALCPHCLHLLRHHLRQVRRRLLPFGLNLHTNRNVHGGVHVPVSDEVALRAPSPTLTQHSRTPCNHEYARMNDANLRAVHQAQIRRQRSTSSLMYGRVAMLLAPSACFLGVSDAFSADTGLQRLVMRPLWSLATAPEPGFVCLRAVAAALLHLL